MVEWTDLKTRTLASHSCVHVVAQAVVLLGIQHVVAIALLLLIGPSGKQQVCLQFVQPCVLC
jgi:hypothetical protein